jgi:hypothetical protein
MDPKQNLDQTLDQALKSLKAEFDLFDFYKNFYTEGCITQELFEKLIQEITVENSPIVVNSEQFKKMIAMMKDIFPDFGVFHFLNNIQIKS